MSFQLVKPDELAREVSKASQDKVEELLRKVDKALRESAMSHGSGYVNALVSISGYNKFVVDEVIYKCSLSGWQANLEYDQQDKCNYLAIKKKTVTSSYSDPREFGSSYFDR